MRPPAETAFSAPTTARSHSRPKIANDTPYSESIFKTMVYMGDFPGDFNSLGDAEVDQQLGDLLGGHGGAAAGVHGPGDDAVAGDGLACE
ncbi:hypothetical protein [Streptomyces stelliscabiei]|uniref:hypothetical protein n=1 Tax=Streptomyces stelliscabiei TaxID=146820 RepID=UPI0038D4EDC2